MSGLTALSNGSVSETVGHGLAVFGGTLTVSACATAPAPSNLSMTWSGGCNSPGTTCAINQPIVFTASTSNYELHDCDVVSWEFGDDAVASGRSVTHSFSGPGSYTVKLKVSNAAGSATLPQVLNVPAPAPSCVPPTMANFAIGWAGTGCATASASCPRSTVIAFTAVPAGSAGDCGFTAVWNFGDGTGGSGQMTSHTYVQAGTYNVSMLVTNPFGQVTITRLFAIGATTSACNVAPSPFNLGISWSGQGCTQSSGTCSPASPITFNALFFFYTPQPCDHITWSFGDGSSGAGQTVLHAFTSPSSYTVSLTVVNDAGSAIVSRQVQVGAGGQPGPECTAQAVSNAPINSPVLFTAGSEPPSLVTTYQWSFGDGSSVTTSLPSAMHAYSQVGTFIWTVVGRSSGGSALCAVTHAIEVGLAKRRGARK
jgi:PKD repeat protein